MASRFPTSNLHNRDPRSALFESYTGDRTRGASSSPSGYGGPAAGAHGGYHSGSGSPSLYGASGSSANGGIDGGLEGGGPAFRSATPNTRGQYSDAVLSSLESQNDEQISVLSDKVRQFKDMTVAIGAEIRSSSSLAESMNESFEGTRVRLRGTMNRMLRMAKRTGVGWRVWLGFLLAVIVLFTWVWLF